MIYVYNKVLKLYFSASKDFKRGVTLELSREYARICDIFYSACHCVYLTDFRLYGYFFI